MIQQDYLLGMIQQLGKFLRRAVSGESASSEIELNQQLEQLTDEILGLPITLITTLPAEKLIGLFEMSDRMVIEKCYLSAEINRLKAEVENDFAEKNRLKERAIFFFTVILPELTGAVAESAKQQLSHLTDESVN